MFGNQVTRSRTLKAKQAYLEHLTLKNQSPLSVKQTDLAIRVFLSWLDGKGVKEIMEVDREVFENYKTWLSGYINRKGDALASKTVIDRLCMVQRWFAWLKKKGFLMYDPIAGVRVPKDKKHLPRGVMRPDEIRKIMEQPDLRSVIGYRDRTMMEVLYSTGARAAELVSLKAPDVDLRKKMVRIRNGKGGKDRFVPLSTPCCRFLDRYLAVIRPELAAGMRPSGNSWLKKSETGKDLLFLSIYGGPVGKVACGHDERVYPQSRDKKSGQPGAFVPAQRGDPLIRGRHGRALCAGVFGAHKY